MAKPNTIVIKLVVVGDSGVGKSCLLWRFADNSYSPEHIATIGVDFRVRQVDIDGKRVKLQVWDTAGQERFRSISSAYYRGAHGFVFVYDKGDPESFQNIHHWVEEVSRQRGPGDTYPRILIANKADRADSTTGVDTARGQALADELGVAFFETSAKDGTHVDSAFMHLANQCVKAVAEKLASAPEGGRELRPNPDNGGKCCN
eukprot:TRINITY_DN2313_c0_g1_i1.p1 TRINITY_DN2313_c0_g1~~TRINITY_DN2313_c0_g1_i1.p1  ORF type:complete len:203 (+),score=69.88 TRINITY_DN2313_c0_g1_i1:58-666(+)